jgi:hypothetical protein
MTEQDEQMTLHHENLIPFYIIEDRIRDNFNKIEKNAKQQFKINQDILAELGRINQHNGDYRQEVNQKFIELEKKIVTEINSELEGRIIVAINKNMAAFTSRMEEKEKEIEAVNEGIADKLDAIKKTIVYDVSKDNQKFFAR